MTTQCHITGLALETKLDYTPENAKASSYHTFSCTVLPQPYSRRLFTKPFSGSYANTIAVYLEELTGSRMVDFTPTPTTVLVSELIHAGYS